MILFGIIFGAIMLGVVTACYILVIAFTIWMAIDAGKQDRFWWLVCIIGIPVIGSSVYYFTEKKHEYAKLTVHHVHESETEDQHEHAPKKRKSRKNKEESVTKVEDKVDMGEVEEAQIADTKEI